MAAGGGRRSALGGVWMRRGAVVSVSSRFHRALGVLSFGGGSWWRWGGVFAVQSYSFRRVENILEARRARRTSASSLIALDRSRVPA